MNIVAVGSTLPQRQRYSLRREQMAHFIGIQGLTALIYTGVAAFLQQVTGIEPSVIGLLIQIPVVAAFIWFVLQLAKIQKEQLSAHQAALEKLSDTHQKERIEITDLWMKWSAERYSMYIAQLTEERTIRREMVATISAEMKSLAETLRQHEISEDEVVASIKKLAEFMLDEKDGQREAKAARGDP